MSWTKFEGFFYLPATLQKARGMRLCTYAPHEDLGAWWLQQCRTDQAHAENQQKLKKRCEELEIEHQVVLGCLGLGGVAIFVKNEVVPHRRLPEKSESF